MRKYLLLLICLLTIPLAAQVIVSVTPNSPSVPSAGQQQFKVSVIGTTNTAVQWFTCGGTIDQSGLFTAPAVTKNTSICVYAISDADPSKSSTAYAQVKAPTTPPEPVATCGTSVWSTSPPTEYYGLPAWMTTPKPAPLTWVQPADLQYQNTEFQSTHYNITAWAPTGNGGDVLFTAVNVLAIGDSVKLSGFQVSKFFNNLTVEVGNSTPTEFVAYIPVTPSSVESDHGAATITYSAAMMTSPTEMLGGVNTGAGGPNQYCQWLLVQGGTPPYSYSATGTPPGLRVNSANGLYSGVSTTPGLYKNVVFCAKDATGTEVCTNPRMQNVCDGGKSACLVTP
jgi:hypothetical protein